MEVSESKRELRQEMRIKRNGFSSFDVKIWSRTIKDYIRQELDWSKIKAAHCYIALPERHEVLTAPLLNYIWSNHKDIDVYAPKENWEVEGFEMAKVDTDTGYARDSRGFLVPRSEAVEDEVKLDVIFVPCLSVDRRGRRLGSGRGYYDRFLKKHPEARKIGLCFSECISDKVPVEEHDQDLDIIVTESEVIKV